MWLRKHIIQKEQVFSEGGGQAPVPIGRVAGIAIIQNPFAGKFVADLSELFDIGGALGEHLLEEMIPLLGSSVVSYGTGAIVGVSGDLEHAHALLHPKLGHSIRNRIGGGQALLPSAAKVASAGAFLDVPLGHKEDAESFDHFDAMTLAVADAPRPYEIMMAVVICDGGRVAPRSGMPRVPI